jgi:hypothetical protein
VKEVLNECFRLSSALCFPVGSSRTTVNSIGFERVDLLRRHYARGLSPDGQRRRCCSVPRPLSGCVVGVKTFPELSNSLGFYSNRGNILLARRGQDEVCYRLDGQTLRARSSGISVALIDFTLSRLNAEGRVLFCDLTADTWLFEGPKGDVQVGRAEIGY